jgi:predicted GNAT family acetyltransferase
MATRLVTHMLDDASRRGLTVLPFCPFVKDFISERKEYLDLVPHGERSRFGLAD